MSDKEKKNQTINILANEIRKLDYFKVFLIQICLSLLIE